MFPFRYAVLGDYMTEKTKGLFHRLEIVGFLLYFLILFCERVLALIFSVGKGGEYALLSGNAFNYVAYTVTAASLVAGTILAAKPFEKMLRALFAGETFAFEKEAQPLSVAVFVLLFGGMMHTGFTLVGLQFAAYGFLIAAFVVRAVERCLDGGDKYQTIVSVVYLTLFSMTIPVCYLSFLSDPLRTLFFVAELFAVAALVPSFGCMLSIYLKRGETSFSPVFPSLMLVLSGATVALQWKEKINYFVLIFMGLTVLTYLAFGLLAWRRRSGKSALANPSREAKEEVE